jgi:hypothetical protein
MRTAHLGFDNASAVYAKRFDVPALVVTRAPIERARVKKSEEILAAQ